MLLWYQGGSRLVPDQYQGNPGAVSGAQDSRNWWVIGRIPVRRFRLTMRWGTTAGDMEKGRE